MELPKILLITLVAWTTSAAEGSYFEAGNFVEASPFLQQHQQQHQAPRPYGYGFGYHEYSLEYNPPKRINSNHGPKQVPAVVPVSPVFQVELMKAMAQLEEKKSVTLYVVPQDSLEVVPHAQQRTSENLRLPPLFEKYQGTLQLTDPLLFAAPNHVPAVEVPLEKPLVIHSAKAEVLAPAGFTVLLNGPQGHPLAYPFATGILLAPVPVGTIISSDTPVVLTTLYAVPSLPVLPSAIKILANFVTDSKGTTKVTTTTITQQGAAPIPAVTPVALLPPRPVNRIPVTVQHLGTPSPISPVRDQVFTYPSSTTVAPVHVGDYGDRLKDEAAVGSNGPSSTGFINSKESPFLLQLREESLKRQIKELQNELARLQQATSLPY